jgi:anionic cell wall polymer biosynthesis LytR-Cps2A-Psr (LCP) family protein
MRNAVEGITGLGIQYYALIDMQGFSDLIDSLGGVTINVQEPVPIHADSEFTIVAEWIPAGVQVMDGYHALWYARSRHDTTDYDRMVRQRKLQQAVIEQFTPSNVLTKVQAIAAASSKVVKTDIPQGSLAYFLNLASKTRGLPIGSLELVPANDIVPESPDFDYLRELVAAAIVPTVVTDRTE